MTAHQEESAARRPAERGWVFGAWVVPLLVAGVITVVTAGFGVIVLPVAIVVGLVATALHRWGSRA